MRLSEDRAGQTCAVFRFRAIGDCFLIGRAKGNIAVFPKRLQHRTCFGRNRIVGACIEYIAHESTAADDT